MRMLLLLLFYA